MSLVVSEYYGVKGVGRLLGLDQAPYADRSVLELASKAFPASKDIFVSINIYSSFKAKDLL